MTSIQTFDVIAHGLSQEILDDELDLWFFIITLEEENIPVNTETMLMLIRRVLVNKEIFMVIRVGYDDYVTYVGHEAIIAKYIEEFLKTLELQNIISDETAYFVTSHGLEYVNANKEKKLSGSFAYNEIINSHLRYKRPRSHSRSTG